MDARHAKFQEDWVNVDDYLTNLNGCGHTLELQRGANWKYTEHAWLRNFYIRLIRYGY